MRVRTAPTVYDHEIASDGLTIDTPRGPVDLVLIRRVIDGHHVEGLTEAEWTYLAEELGLLPRERNGYEAEHDARHRAAESLELVPPALSGRITYRLRRDQSTTARKVA
jgi:hypothetical protein